MIRYDLLTVIIYTGITTVITISNSKDSVLVLKEYYGSITITQVFMAFIKSKNPRS